MTRLLMHVDLDAFYAAVEQRDQPAWRGLAVVVGAEPGKRGVVATCSYEARRFGVRSAMPIAEAVPRLPPETVYVRPRMGHYAAVSRRVMAALESISPVIEQVSIGEDVLDAAILRDTLRWAAQEVGFLARHEGRKGSVVALKIRLHPFETADTSGADRER
jgi:DNA polymerase-4